MSLFLSLFTGCVFFCLAVITFAFAQTGENCDAEKQTLSVLLTEANSRVAQLSGEISKLKTQNDKLNKNATGEKHGE